MIPTFLFAAAFDFAFAKFTRNLGRAFRDLELWSAVRVFLLPSRVRGGRPAARDDLG